VGSAVGWGFDSTIKLRVGKPVDNVGEGVSAAESPVLAQLVNTTTSKVNANKFIGTLPTRNSITEYPS
jgi:hypothetical protein